MTMKTSRRPADMLRAMVRIRAFEEALLASSGAGLQALSGEEAVAVGTCAALEPGDQILTSGRSAGPALARGQAALTGDLSAAEGLALALQQAGSDNVVVYMFADGTAGAGALHQTLNFAALTKLPLVFVCTSRRPVSRSVGVANDNLADLASPLQIFTRAVDGTNLLAVRGALDEAVAYARNGQGPALIDCCVSTHLPASDAGEVFRARCPIETFAAGFDLGPELEAARANVRREMADAVQPAQVERIAA
jgi:TPP-dependent pyruvate/acetoin dehydrogenase alpha subunit